MSDVTCKTSIYYYREEELLLVNKMCMSVAPQEAHNVMFVRSITVYSQGDRYNIHSQLEHCKLVL